MAKVDGSGASTRKKGAKKKSEAKAPSGGGGEVAKERKLKKRKKSHASGADEGAPLLEPKPKPKIKTERKIGTPEEPGSKAELTEASGGLTLPRKRRKDQGEGSANRAADKDLAAVQEQASRPALDDSDDGGKNDDESDADSFFAAGGEEGGDAQSATDASLTDSKGGSNDLKVFVGNLPLSASQLEVKNKFGVFGDIVRFDMPLGDDRKPKGMAFVYYASEDEVNSALELDGTDFDGSTIKVRRAAPQNKQLRHAMDKAERERTDQVTVFITGLPLDMNLDLLKTDFSECGEIQAVRTLTNKDGSFKGTAFLVFNTERSMRNALEWNGHYYKESKIIVRRTGSEIGKGDTKGKAKGKAKGKSSGDDWSQGKGKNGKGEKGKSAVKGSWNTDHDRTVFVGSLFEGAEEQQLRKDFSKCGEIEKIRMLKDAEGWFKGAAFMVYTTVEGSQKALKMDGEKYNGRVIKVSPLKR
ncbi:unnamed protein product [Polarella glacialis]|uniref:RRM domain-containing protein n=1 Tax=Polarella glacialis TaxID=89957 RepID=A0A813IGN2_POLGL|nr:unnamed protein product [Polarella glacialis]